MDPGAAWGFGRMLEEVASGLVTTSTDSNGEFLFTGLEEHSYRLRLIESDSLLSFVSESIFPGSGPQEIVFERTMLGAIAGHIVGSDGVGIAGVTVAVSLKRPNALDIGKSTIKHAAGRFKLDSVTLEPESLRLTGKPIVFELFRTLPLGANLEALELEVSRLCEFQVDWGLDAARASEVFLAGADHAPIEMVNTEGNGIGILENLLGSQGLSPVVGISDKTVEAIVMRAGVEVERFAIYPAPGELVLLRL
ncbi:MAG: hypothetical protein ACI8TQ_000292 [Planctomycetota bacterium]|jgi:hypothetical protein